MLAPTPALADWLNPYPFGSQGTLSLSSGVYTINTSGAAPVLMDSSNNVLYTGTTFDQGGSFNPSVAVLDFNSISIGVGVTIYVTGSDPLALLSRGDSSISDGINANGSNGGDGQSSPLKVDL